MGITRGKIVKKKKSPQETESSSGIFVNDLCIGTLRNLMIIAVGIIDLKN